MTTQSVDAMKATLTSRRGIARPNRFVIELPSLGSGGEVVKAMNVLCRTCTMPGKQITTMDRRIGMEFEKIAYGYAVDDVSMTFLMSNDYLVKKYFDGWKNLIIDEDRQVAAYKKDYARPVKIHQLAEGISNANININLGVANNTVSVGLSLNSWLNSLAQKNNINVSESVYGVELIDAFPTTMNSIEFNNDADGMVEYTVQFSYTNWKRVQNSQIAFQF
tara:strand:+ start:84 stop:743 length:660 start_codon:yes stop_codon:yes gene_type:complete